MSSIKSFLAPSPSADQTGPWEKNALIQRHFDAVARHYDLANSIMSLGMHYLWKRLAVKLLDPRPGQRLADVCGGTADLALLAQRRRATGAVVVYDLNRAMLERGRAKAQGRPHGRELYFVRGDAHRLALSSGSLDAVMVGFGVRNLTDLVQGFAEMARVLKPGGRLMCLEFSQPPAAWFGRLYDLYSALLMPLAGRVFTGSWGTYSYLAGSIRAFPPPRELARLMEEAGLSQVSWQRLSGGIATIHLAVKP